MMRHAVLAVILMAIGAPAAAECRAKLDLSRAAFPFAEYDPFVANTTIIPLDVTIQNRSDETCDARLTVHGASGQRFMHADGRLAYEIVSASGLILRNDPGAQFGLPVRLAPGDRKSVRLAIRIAPGQIVRSGPFNDRINLDRYTAAGDLLDGNSNLPMQVRVRSRTQINVSGGDSGSGVAGGTSVDFGEIRGGKQRRLLLQLRANSAARIIVASENQGRLANVGIPGSAKIPYTLHIDGQKLDLQQPSQLSRRPPLTLDGINYDLQLRISDAPATYAGAYKDTITLTVEPEE